MKNIKKFMSITLVAATIASLSVGCAKEYTFEDVKVGMEEQVLVEMFPDHNISGESTDGKAKVFSSNGDDGYFEVIINNKKVVSKVKY